MLIVELLLTGFESCTNQPKQENFRHNSSDVWQCLIGRTNAALRSSPNVINHTVYWGQTHRHDVDDTRRLHPYILTTLYRLWLVTKRRHLRGEIASTKVFGVIPRTFETSCLQHTYSSSNFDSLLCHLSVSQSGSMFTTLFLAPRLYTVHAWCTI